MKSVGVGVLITCVAFALGFLAPPLGTVAGVALAPGAYLPAQYWGGFHDAGPILLALILNVAFYSIVTAAVRAIWKAARRSTDVGAEEDAR